MKMKYIAPNKGESWEQWLTSRAESDATNCYQLDPEEVLAHFRDLLAAGENEDEAAWLCAERFGFFDTIQFEPWIEDVAA